jgi:mutator protein MutT
MMRPRLAALSVVIRADQVLLVRRRNPPEAGVWGFPGGKVEFGETVQQAAVRELHEETTITGSATRVLAGLDLIDPNGTPAAFHYHLVRVVCDYLQGQPVAQDDALEAEWVPIQKVKTQEFPLSSGVRDVLQEALS